ncbi:MAG: Gfo/Idh/MocA family oxidoreductase [Anaerolineae bacterium]|nr:Gfo/Idh/MocA family oxidoreductase [Anaerolineae bacterium]
MRVAIVGQSHDYQRALSGFPDITLIGATDQPLDAAIVAVPLDQRADQITRLAPITKRVLCEIPFSATDTESLIQSCQAQGAALYPAFRLRHLPVFQSLKAMIGQGQLGQPLSVKVQHRAIRTATLLTNTMQVIDLLRWLLDTDITDQHAETMDSGAILSVALANGAYATLDVSLSLPPTYPAPETLELEIIGTGGWARIDAFRQTIETYTAQGAIQSNWGSDPITELLRAFIADQSMATVQDALRAQTIVQTLL